MLDLVALTVKDARAFTTNTHRANTEAVVRPRSTKGTHAGNAHYGTPLDDKHEDWRAAHRNMRPRHRAEQRESWAMRALHPDDANIAAVKAKLDARMDAALVRITASTDRMDARRNG